MDRPIAGRPEALAYRQHGVLNARLLECTQLLLDIREGDIVDILGYPDDLKFRSSMTLFAATEDGGGVFRKALDRYFAGQPDERRSQIEIGVCPVEALQALDQHRRNDQHRIREFIGVADEEAWVLRRWRRHEVEIHSQSR